MQTVSRLLVAYAVNALWQLPLLVVATEIVARLLGRTPGKILHHVWLGCLFLALTVPALSFLQMPHRVFSAGPIRSQVPVAQPSGDGRQSLDLAFFGQQLENSAHTPERTADFPDLISGAALFLYLASVLFALSRLAWGIRKTHTLIHSAEDLRLTEEVQQSWSSCLAMFGIPRIRLMSSSQLGAPATVTWGVPIVLLPARLNEEHAKDMTAMFCHELAHVRRRDFLCNILIEMSGVVIFYHPAFHWMRRRIHETRELACDDMAANAMAGRNVYASSLLRLTQKMLSGAAVPKADLAIGIFEGEILEKRIMNLLENKSKPSRLRAVTSLAFGACLLFGTCVLSVNLGLKPVHAQAAPGSQSAPSGWFMAGSKPADYQTGVDKTMTHDGQPSAYLKSIAPVSGGFGTLMQQISAVDYAGKRVRVRAWVRSQNVTGWAGMWMRVDKDATTLAIDNMQHRAINGTQPWKQYDVVLDVQEDATGIFFGTLLSGSGEVWTNDVSFEVVGNDVPVTAQPSSARKLPAHPANLKFTE